MVRIPKFKEDLTSEWFEELKNSDIEESDWLDYKLEETNKIGHCIASFLNKESGGLILFGMEKEKRIKQFKFSNILDQQKIINDSLSKYLKDITDPAFNEVKFEPINCEHHKVIAIFISSGKKFPYFYNGKIYVRMGTDSQPVTDKRMIMSLLSHEMNLSKALRIMKNELKLIKEDTKLIANCLPILKSNKETYGIWGKINDIPKKLDDSKIREIFLIIEPYLIEKNLSESYNSILQKINYINMKHDLLISAFMTKPTIEFKEFCNFGTLPQDLLQLIDGLEKNV